MIPWDAESNVTACDDASSSRVTGDDGTRLHIDGIPIVDEWKNQPATTFEETVKLAAGTHALKVEFYENTGNAVARVDWERISSKTEKRPPPPRLGPVIPLPKSPRPRPAQ